MENTCEGITRVCETRGGADGGGSAPRQTLSIACDARYGSSSVYTGGDVENTIATILDGVTQAGLAEVAWTTSSGILPRLERCGRSRAYLGRAVVQRASEA